MPVPRTARLGLAALLLGVALAGAGCAPAGQTVTIVIENSHFDISEVRVPAGEPITFVLVNADPIDHEWLIGDAEFHDRHRSGNHEAHGAVPNEVTIPALDVATTVLTFDEVGSVAYICHIPGHEAYGMVGVVIVTGDEGEIG